jgi:DNA repair protein RecO (recombination protein O)
MKSHTVTGVVLKAVNYKDADKIYTIFTREKGKISVLGKGVRKISSKRAGIMDTLNHVQVGLAEMPNGYKVLTEAKNVSSFRKLKESLENSVRGFYLAELIHRVMQEEHQHVEVFDLFLQTLAKLDHHLNNEVSRINAFEIALLGELGYEMYLDKCAKTDIPYDDSWESIKFNPVMGGFVSDITTPGINLTRETADLLFSLKTKKSISKELLANETAVQEADRMVKIFIKEVLDENLKSSRILV